MKKNVFDVISNEPAPYIDNYVLDGVEFGRSQFNLEWISAVTESP